MKTATQCLVLSVVLFACANATQYLREGSDGRQYLIESDQKYNWHQAFHKCLQKNLQLVEINSSEKNSVVTSVMRSIFDKPPNLWMGANDEFSVATDYNRPFYWSTTGTLMTYSNWSKKNSGKGEHCVHFWDKYPFQWNDNVCTVKMGFICEPKYVDEQHCQDLEKKRQDLNASIAKVNEYNSQQQQQQIDNVENGVNNFKLVAKQFDDVFRAVQTKLISDIQQLLSQGVNVTLTAAEERNESMNEHGIEMTSALAEAYKEFSDKLVSAGKDIDNTLVC